MQCVGVFQYSGRTWSVLILLGMSQLLVTNKHAVCWCVAVFGQDMASADPGCAHVHPWLLSRPPRLLRMEGLRRLQL